MTNEERHKINMIDDNSCSRCQQGDEVIFDFKRP
jgi:hypothetical protein